jgi:CIC family chloride channel protein
MDGLRLRLGRVDAVPQLAIVGMITGVVAGLVIIAFRLLIETTQAAFLPEARPENYEGLAPLMRVLLPVSGGLLVGIALHAVGPDARRVGIVHVMERLAYHQGRIPLRNAVTQFFGAATSIILGHSVGREGPGIHLGAASGSILGQRLGLPNNSLRTLVGCGAAAAIGAYFNTPLAGVVFAMEVLLMEYTIAGFTPVILAAVTATTLSRVVHGSAPAFAVPAVTLGSLMELPYVIGMGVVIGTLAALLVRSLTFFSVALPRWPIWIKTTLTGLVVGLCALVIPEIMGVGYDTVELALLGELSLWTLLGLVAFKLFATSLSLGFGVPGGIIGPTLIIGAGAGGAMGYVAEQWFPGAVSSHAFYAVMGMGAMMGATLQAPLAALTAMLELTANPHIILPGMLAVIASALISKQIFRTDSVYLALIRARGLDYQNDPVAQSLRSVGVTGAMERDFVAVPRHMTREHMEGILRQQPRWLLIEEDRRPIALMPAADLIRHLQEDGEPEQAEIDLLDIPAHRRQVAGVHYQATLQEALDTLRSESAEALYVKRPIAPGIDKVYGVLTLQDIESNYRY